MIYAKIAGILTILAGAFWAGWAINGDRATAAANALHAGQLSAVATAYQTQVLALQASEAKLQTVENQYDAIKDLPDVAAPVIAQRVLYAACPASGQLSQSRTVAGGVPATAAVAIGPSSIADALGNLLSACDADAKRLAAVQALAPNQKVSP